MVLRSFWRKKMYLFVLFYVNCICYLNYFKLFDRFNFLNQKNLICFNSETYLYKGVYCCFFDILKFSKFALHVNKSQKTVL